jgi:hypothetical protein
MRVLLILALAGLALGQQDAVNRMVRSGGDLNRVVKSSDPIDYDEETTSTRHASTSKTTETPTTETPTTETPTTKPITKPITELTKTTEAPTTKPVTGPATCDDITAYFVGSFKFPWTSIVPSFNAQLQVKMRIDRTKKRVWMTSETINKTYSSPGKTIYTHFHTADYTEDVWTDWMGKDKWSIPFVRAPTHFDFHIHASYEVKSSSSQHGSTEDNLHTIMTFPKFNNVFVLNEAAGGCTKTQIINPEIRVDDKMFEYCVCCGEYKEGGPLNCPKNPWLHNPQAEELSTTRKPTPTRSPYNYQPHKPKPAAAKRSNSPKKRNNPPKKRNNPLKKRVAHKKRNTPTKRRINKRVAHNQGR